MRSSAKVVHKGRIFNNLFKFFFLQDASSNVFKDILNTKIIITYKKKSHIKKNYIIIIILSLL